MVEPQRDGVHHVRAQIEAFVATFASQLGREVLAQNEFNDLRRALCAELQAPFKSVTEGSEHLTNCIMERERQFGITMKWVEEVQALTYADFLEFCREALRLDRPSRLDIMVEGQLAGEVEVVPEQGLTTGPA